jgi:zinc-ribbon domain
MGIDLDSPDPPADGPARADGSPQPGGAVPVLPPSFGASDEGATETLVAGTVGDRCVNCGAPLSSDQRYCINCGERRGAARFTLPVAAAASAEPPPSTPPRRQRTGRARPSQGATLIAGVGTLLLALGVGVLIGHGSGGTKTVSSPHAQVITVNAGAAAPSSGAAATTATSQTSSSGGSAKHSKKKSQGGGSSSKGKSSHKAKQHTAPAAPKPTKQEADAAQSAANKVTGGSDVNNAPVTVTSGQSCSGQGCQGGKFTGNFFGGGG